MTDAHETIVDHWTMSVFELAGRVNSGDLSLEAANQMLQTCLCIHATQNADPASKAEAFTNLSVYLYDSGLSEREIDLMLAGLARGKMAPGPMH